MNPGRMLTVALAAGLVVATVEMVFVLPIQAFGLRHSPEVVFQSIVAGALGRAAFSGGLALAHVDDLADADIGVQPVGPPLGQLHSEYGAPRVAHHEIFFLA